MIPIDQADIRPMAATPASRPWVRLLAWTAAVGAGVDGAVMGVLGEVIPPVLAGVVLTLAGLALLRRRPRVGIGLLGVVGVLLVVSGAPFALPNVGHPESAVGFGHAVIHLLTRPVTMVAAVGAWRQVSPVAARRLGTVTAGGLAATVVVAVVASVADPGDTAEPGDVVAEVRDVEFPAEVRVASGGTLFVDNTDLIRHTFTVEGTALSPPRPHRAALRGRARSGHVTGPLQRARPRVDGSPPRRRLTTPRPNLRRHQMVYPTRPRALRAVATLAAVAALAGGCGDDEDVADVGATTPTTAVAKEGDAVDVVAADYAFQDLPDRIDAGSRLSLRNSSKTELHELVAVRVPDDERRSAQELLRLPENELRALFPGEPAVVLVAPPAENGFAAVGDGTLSEPGRYVVFCAIPVGADPEEYLRQGAGIEGRPARRRHGPAPLHAGHVRRAHHQVTATPRRSRRRTPLPPPGLTLVSGRMSSATAARPSPVSTDLYAARTDARGHGGTSPANTKPSHESPSSLVESAAFRRPA